MSNPDRDAPAKARLSGLEKDLNMHGNRNIVSYTDDLAH
jgi:hypothetical protein